MIIYTSNYMYLLSMLNKAHFVAIGIVRNIDGYVSD